MVQYYVMICLVFAETQDYRIKQDCASFKGFSGGSVVKNSLANAGDTTSIPGLGRSPEEGNGNPLQYSCLGNPMNRGTWRATVHGVTKESDTTKRLQHAAAAAKSLQSYLTLRDPMDYSLPGSSVHGVFQARVLEWVAIAFSDTTT